MYYTFFFFFSNLLYIYIYIFNFFFINLIYFHGLFLKKSYNLIFITMVIKNFKKNYVFVN